MNIQNRSNVEKLGRWPLVSNIQAQRIQESMRVAAAKRKHERAEKAAVLAGNESMNRGARKVWSHADYAVAVAAFKSAWRAE